MTNKKIGVVGAGIVGATTAFYLAKEGYSVTLYDDGNGQATAAAAGIICPWLSQRRNKEWYQLAATGAAFYPQLIRDLGEDHSDSEIYQQVGALIFKKNPATLLKLEKLALQRRETAPEIGELKILSPSEIEAIIPLLKTSESALFASGGARVDGHLLTKKLIELMIDNGGIFETGKVSLQQTNHQLINIHSATGVESYQQIVLAVGAWLPELLTPLGYSVDIRPQKGQLAHLHLSTGDNSQQWPVVIPHGEKDIIPFSHGHILVGATHENDLGYDLSPTSTEIKAMIREASELAPELSTADLVETKVGTRAYTSDFAPFFGPIPDNPQLYVASGLGSSGLTTGPLIGKMLAQLVMEQEIPLAVEDYPVKNYVKR